jgi:eukaryotic-like serine/threonine-protein kinase
MKYCSVCNQKFEDTISFCPTDGEVLEEDPGSLVGTALDGQYQIEALLGKGGMGAVYRARHILLGDRVAIKILPPEMRSNSEWLRRFQREGQAARRFRHPNAVTVYDLRTSADGTIYLVMEYVEGNTLDGELKQRGKFSATETLTVMTPVMSVLNAAHAMGVVHRDLKPENIMIGKASTGGEPVVKLLDLGIAKLREVAGAEKTGNTNLTIAGQMLGTPYYMSPEQWGELPDDGNSEIDGRADIYSLGVVMYEIIAGRRPFGGMTLPELRREHIQVTPPPLHEVVAGVPEAFSRAIARAMAKDRSNRQETAGELENELISALSAQGIPTMVSLADMSLTPAEPGAGRGVTTSPHQTAATLVTGIGDSNAAKSAEQKIPSQAATLPTVIAKPKPQPSVAPATMVVPAPSVPSAALLQAPARRGNGLLFAGIGLVALLLIAGGGGYIVMHTMMNKSPSTAPSNPATATSGAADVSAGHEVGRFWLQVNDRSDAVRAGEAVAMKPGQQFKFHFSPSENGYLYIVGPGTTNAPTTFLTARPAQDFGVRSNEIKSGDNFIFPQDTSKAENWMNLDQQAGSDEFTVIFSGRPLTKPDFLNSAALHELNQDEQKQLSDFIAQAKANLLGTEVIKTGASPFVSVKVPQTASEGAPVVFKIKIDHQ